MTAGAYALRLFRLGDPSLGYDESFNLLVAGSQFDRLPELLATSEPYPPLHFALLHLWLRAAGQSEFAARYWALLAGVLLVPITVRIAARWLGTPAGLATGLVVAGSPAYLWYAQEIKMYPLLATLAALSFYFFARLVLGSDPASGRPCPARRPGLLWLGYVVSTSAALYVQYAAAFFIAFEWIVAWYVGVRRGRGALGRWLAAQAAVVILFLPWLWFARRLLGGYQSDAPTAVNPLLTLRTIWQVFAVGYSDELQHRLGGEFWVGLVWAGATLIALIGLVWPGLGPAPTRSRRLIAGSCLLPLGLFLAAAAWRPVFAARHATTVSLGFYLMIGGGLGYLTGLLRPTWASVRRLVPFERSLALAAGLTLSLVGVIWIVSIRDYFADPAYERTDNRGVADYIRAQGGPDDLIIVDAPYFAPAVLYYRPGPEAVIGLPVERPADPERTAARLEAAIRGHDRIWLVLWQDYFADPTQLVERWLNRNTTRLVEKRLASIRLAGYATGGEPLSGARPARSLSAEFGGQIRLLGYTLTRDPAGDLDLDLFWQATRRVDASYTVFVHVLDREEQRIGQWDQQPRSGLAPTQDWLPGEIIRDHYHLAVSPGGSPDRLAVGLYNAANQTRLPVTTADATDAAVIVPVRCDEQGNC